MKFAPPSRPRRRTSKTRKSSSSFKGRDQDLLLEHNAELLKALEHIALRWLWLDPQFYGRIRFDAGGYRAARIEELKLSARVAAERVRESHSPFRFNAMSARERRILHLVLKEEARRADRKRRRRRRAPSRCVPCRLRNRSGVSYSGLLNPWEIYVPSGIKNNLKCKSWAVDLPLGAGACRMRFIVPLL